MTDDMADLSDPRLDRVFSEYAERTAAAAPQPDLGRVQALAARRRRTAVAATTAVAAVAVAIPVAAQTMDWFPGGAGLQRPGGDGPGWFSYGPGPDRPQLTPGTPVSTTPLPNTSPGNAIQFVDWNEATLAVPANESGCTHSMAKFRQGLSLYNGVGYRVGGGYNREENPVVAYGDVTGDGVLDAALVVSCVDTTPRVNPPSVLLLVTGEPDLHTLGVAYSTKPRQPDGEGQDFINSLEVLPDGTVVFRVRTFEGLSECEWRGRWTGERFDGACQP